MNGKNFNKPVNKRRVLIAPLEWGLGHATRCIPIIIRLLEQGCEVIVAGGGPGKQLLKTEFPGLTFLELEGYGIRYSTKKSWMPVKMLIQFPKIINSVYYEHRWLKKIVEQYSVDLVISDNRFGLSHQRVSCIYITHQLKIKTGNRITDWIAQRIHYWFINKYSECWVPDTGEKNNLAGELSHPSNMPRVPVKYTGPISRFEINAAEKKYDLTIILSGPEPQRTIFEEIIVADLKKYRGSVLLVRGLPGKKNTEQYNHSSFEVRDHLSSEELNLAILQSELIIARCGYSTVMDLVKLQKKAILVPTPGQTEQEYLAEYLMQKKIFYCIKQKDFILPVALKAAGGFSFINTGAYKNNYRQAIEDALKKLS